MNWEEEFKEHFPNIRVTYEFPYQKAAIAEDWEIPSFIDKVLAAQKQELKREIEAMRVPESKIDKTSYSVSAERDYSRNETIDAILEKLDL